MNSIQQNKKYVLISDPSLRDGNHAVAHQLNKEQIAAYCRAADEAGVPIIEVGHGNGLAASSLQVGLCSLTDEELITTARANIKKAKLGIHCIPSFATINRDLKPAIEMGVDVIRIATHCTEADTTQRQIEYVANAGVEVYGALMMTHMASAQTLAEECKKMESYGAKGVVLMDSVGAFLPSDVKEKISAVADKLTVPVGFHAHNNLGMAIANSIAALEAGAGFLDACARGFGAGAGNAQLEVLVAVLHKMGYETGIDLNKILEAAELAERDLMKVIPTIKTTSIVSGIAGVFSGFAKHVERVSMQYGIDKKDLFFELGRRKIIAGQEDMIIEIAMDLVEKNRATANLQS